MMPVDIAPAVPSNETKTTYTRLTRDGRKITYQLHIIQQPEQARACGSGAKASADRRPVDPPPIVELRIFEGEESSWTDVTLSYNANFFLFATLEHAREIATPRNLADKNNLTVLTGTPVSGLVYLDRPHQAGYFLFSDLSVRHEGMYRLAFNLYEELKEDKDADPDSPSTASPSNPHVNHRIEVKSVPFSVFSAKKFPGLKESTELSRTVADQGCRVRIRKDVRIKKRDKSSVEEIEFYVPPLPEFTKQGDAKGMTATPSEQDMMGDVASQGHCHSQPQPQNIYQQVPAPQQAYPSGTQSCYAGQPGHQAYGQPSYQAYQVYDQQQAATQYAQSVPPPTQQYQHPQPVAQPHPSAYQTYQHPPAAYQAAQSSHGPGSTASYDQHYAMSTASSSDSRPVTTSGHQAAPQHTAPTPQNYRQSPAQVYKATVPAPTVHPAHQHDRAQYPFYNSQPVPQQQRPLLRSLPTLNTTHQVASHLLEASSPASAGLSPGYESTMRHPRFSLDSGIGAGTTIGKRAYGEVFDTRHIDRCLRGGERPEMGVGIENGHLTIVDHDSGEESAQDILDRLRYKRADGRLIAKPVPTTP